MPTKQEYRVSKQRTRNLYTKIEVLDFDLNVLDNLNGVVIGVPTFNINSDSDIRRTCDISLIATDSSFDITNGNKIWLNRYIRIYVGILDVKTEDIIYTNMGIYLIDNPSRVYSASENTLTFKCVDMMSQFTGLRNGYMEGIEHQIPQDTNIKEFLINLFKLVKTELGINVKYKDEYISESYYDDDKTICNVPNDLTVGTDSTVYDLLNEIIKINPSYQVYFDVDGYFHYDKIPQSGENIDIIANDDLWGSVLSTYTVSTDFENVKNVIEILGHTWDVPYYGNTKIESAVLFTTIEGMPIKKGTLIGFTTPKSGNIPNKINISNGTRMTGNLNIVDEAGNIPTLKKNTTYVGYYRIKNEVPYFLYQSEIQAKATIQDDNKESPYYIGNIGKIRIVLQDGDYENLYSDLQCESCAKKELYNRCRLSDSLSFTCLPVYWLDVNKVIELTLINKQGVEETNKYLIKSISISDTQNVDAMRIYE